MIIHTLELKNWGPHEKFSSNIEAPLVGIAGSNGKGKSTILHAIGYAITGELPPDRRQDSYIRNFGSPNGAKKAEVVMTFSVHGEMGTVSRSVTSSTSSRKLEWRGETYTKAADVKNMMQEIVGANVQALLNAVFVRQGTLNDIVKGTPAERFSLMQNLMNLSYINSRTNYITSKITDLKKKVVDYAPVLEAQQEQLRQANEYLASAQEQLSFTKDQANIVAVCERYVRVASAFSGGDEALAGLRSQSVAASDELKTLRDAHYGKFLHYDPESERQSLANEQAAADNYKRYLTTKQHIDSDKARQAELSNALLGVSTRIMDIEDDGNLADLNSRYLELSNAISSNQFKEQNKQQLDALIPQVRLEQEQADTALANKEKAETALATMRPQVEIGLAVTRKDIELCNLKLDIIHRIGAHSNSCPLCGSVVSDMEDEATVAGKLSLLMEQEKACNEQLEKLESDKNEWALRHTSLLSSLVNKKAQLARLSEAEPPMTPDQLAAKQEEMSTTHATMQELQDLITQKNNLVNQMQSIADNVARMSEGLVEVAAPTTTAEEQAARQQTLDEYDTSLTKVRTAEQRNHAVTESLLTAVNDRARKQQEVEQAQREVEESISDMPLVSLDSVRSRISQMQEDQQKRQKLLAVVEEAERSVELSRSDIRTTHAKMDEDFKTRKLIRNLEDVKQLVSNQGAPRAYMQQLFELIVREAEDILIHLDANFSIDIDPNNFLSVTFVRTDSEDSYPMPQNLLSGGQSIRLALALLLSIQRIVLPEVGLLVLDEPSSHVDEEGVQAMRLMLSKISEIPVFNNMQLIVVDHNKDLMSVAQKSITL